MKRLFFAYDIDSPLREAVAARAGALRDSLGELSSAVRWVVSENYHMTAAFLGDTYEEALPTLRTALESMPPLLAPEVAIGPSLVFPRPREPRVLVLTISTGKEQLLVITENLRSELRSRSVNFDTKPFRPHLTIGYLRRRPRKVQRAVADRWLETGREENGGSVTALTLYESTLTSQGPQYTAVVSRKTQAQT